MPRRIPSTGPSRFGGRLRAPAGGGRGRQPNGFGLGPGGECICPNCGTRVSHGRGVPCYTYKCPKCGTAMARTE